MKVWIHNKPHLLGEIISTHVVMEDDGYGPSSSAYAVIAWEDGTLGYPNITVLRHGNPSRQPIGMTIGGGIPTRYFNRLCDAGLVYLDELTRRSPAELRAITTGIPLDRCKDIIQMAMQYLTSGQYPMTDPSWEEA